MPETPDPIPADILASPIIGEARRFAGATAPSGWTFAQGQMLNVADNTRLFSLLGTGAGGDGKTTFKLPNLSYGLIIAVAGWWPTTPSALARSARHMTPKDSLGPGAQPAMPRMPKMPPPAVLEARRLATSTIRVGRASAVPVSREMQESFARAHQDAGAAAAERLSSSSRARLEAAIQALLDGRISSNDAVLELQSLLSTAEANAVLDVNDAMNLRFNDRWGGSDRRYAQVDAANFLLSVSVTREQERALYRRELNSGQ